MDVKVYELEFDEHNTSEMRRHGVTEREVRQALDGSPKFFPNKKRHRASMIMVGRTAGGRLITVPLEDRTSGTWRPATAYDSNVPEQSVYANAGGL